MLQPSWLKPSEEKSKILRWFDGHRSALLNPRCYSNLRFLPTPKGKSLLEGKDGGAKSWQRKKVKDSCGETLLVWFRFFRSVCYIQPVWIGFWMNFCFWFWDSEVLLMCVLWDFSSKFEDFLDLISTLTVV